VAPDPDQPLLRALRHETCDPPPIWLMRQAGRYLPEYRKLRAEVGGFLELCYTPALAAEVTMQPARRFGLDAAILFSDILVIPDALGQEVSFREGIGPVLAPIEDEKGLAVLSLTKMASHLAPVYDAASLVAAGVPRNVTLIGFAGAPWTVAAYMIEGRTSRDFAKAKRWALTKPESFGRLIGLLVEATVNHLSAQIEAGAGVVQIFDSWAGALPAEAFDRWSISPTAEIVARLHAIHPGIPVIGFPRGCGLRAAEYAERTGVAAVSIDSSMPAEWARDHLQTRWTVQGNLDQVLLVAGGEAMAREAARLKSVLGSGPWIFNLGHGVTPDTPPDHVGELVALVRGG
jgi:uroporphyrinogen decarboxylase